MPSLLSRLNPALGFVALLMLPGVAHGQSVPINLPTSADVLPSFVGLGYGATPSWHGSDKQVSGIAPGARWSLDEGRFVEWYGTYVGFNALDNSHGWEMGPIATYRFGRTDTGIDALELLPEVAGGWDVGGFIGYSDISMLGPLPVRWRASVSATTGLSADNPGKNLSLYGSVWAPLSRSTFVGLGGGLTYSDDERMGLLFSVDEQHTEPSALDAYEAKAGLRQTVAWLGVLHQLTPRWLIGAMAYRQQLADQAAHSPIITHHGATSLWTYGVGVGYSF